MEKLTLKTGADLNVSSNNVYNGDKALIFSATEIFMQEVIKVFLILQQHNPKLKVLNANTVTRCINYVCIIPNGVVYKLKDLLQNLYFPQEDDGDTKVNYVAPRILEHYVKHKKRVEQHDVALNQYHTQANMQNIPIHERKTERDATKNMVKMLVDDYIVEEEEEHVEEETDEEETEEMEKQTITCECNVCSAVRNVELITDYSTSDNPFVNSMMQNMVKMNKKLKHR